jgi:hypothetical protein
VASETNIIEFPVTQGQNEGQAIQVLPVGQFSSVQNARFRKQNLLGKRNGYTSKSSLDSEGGALGNGNGLLTCLGPDFCAVDDRFYRRSFLYDNWIAEPSIGVTGASRRTWNPFPQFAPGPIIEPPIRESVENGSQTVSGMTTGLGLVWTAEGVIYNGAWYISVRALNPDSGVVEFEQDVPISLAAAALTDTPGVKLFSTPTPDTIVLLVDSFTASVMSGVRIYYLTDLINGFSQAAAPTFSCVEFAANYYPASSTLLLCAYALTGSPTTFRIGTLDPVTGAVVQTASVASAGNKTRLSVFGLVGGGVCSGFYDAGAVRVDVRNAAWAQTGFFSVTASVTGAIGPVMFGEHIGASTYPITAVVMQTAAGPVQNICALDFSTTGAVPAQATLQRNCHPLSQPFSIGSQLFIWLRYIADDSVGVATLVRIPHDSEWNDLSVFPGVFPVQATLDDRDVATPQRFFTNSGSTLPLPLPMSNGYNALVTYTRSSFVSSSVTFLLRSIAVVPVRHRSEGIRYALSSVTPCCGRQFVAGAQPLWVDSAAAYEAGFIQAPYSLAAPSELAGGGLTLLGTYSYTAVFESAVGTVIERSAPAFPVSITLTGANQQTTTTWSTMELGNRQSVTCKIYRTAANGSVFYFVNKFDATPGAGTAGFLAFNDTSTDIDIIQNEPLYTNVGQEIPASNFPACTFSNVGGNRLWCGGGFASNIVQASKQFAPHLCPEFADDDAFRVTLPAACTGSAWCDSQVLFTQEGIYRVDGDGPNGAGEGFFTTTRLPFNIGCIDWRSVVVCDMGVMFQSPRGLHLLPRGFGQPIPMDQVIDTLTTYPIITSARSDYNSTGGADNSEQIVQWTAVADEAATSGVVITFDSAYKAFYVDTFGADRPAAFQSGWGGDTVHAPALMTIGTNGASRWHPFRVYDTTDFDDEGLAVAFMAITGDVRPWGTFAHGVVNRVGVLMVLGSACTVSVTKTTDKGSRATSRGYSGTAPDYVAGNDVYLDVELGNTEQRDITALRFKYFESSTVEGMAIIGIVVEADNKPQGFRLLKPADRIV